MIVNKLVEHKSQPRVPSVIYIHCNLRNAVLGAQAKAVHGSLTIPASGWSSDSTATYSKYYDVAVSGITASDRASVDLAPASAATAVKCGLCPACETLAGKIRIRAVSVPTASMTANY